MRYYIIAGEASGDLHGSNLIKALVKQDSAADIYCWGGDKMEAAGAKLVKHYRDLAFMGFVEVIKHLGTIFHNLDFCKKDILIQKPDVLVLIDYPGFNLRIASWAHKQGIKVVYYISPQVWAWKEGRVKQIKRDVDKMIVILPFEVDFYKNWDFPVSYVGHPLTEVVSDELKSPNSLPKASKPIVAILPGSRSQEIKLKLPIMLSVVKYFPDHDFVIAQAPSQPDSLYEEIIAGNLAVILVKGKTYDLLKVARAALVTSGTATLETALFGVPQVVCYKGNALSFWLAKKLVKVKYVSLVNLIMDKAVVKELLQDDLNEQHLRQELALLLADGPYRQQMKAEYAQLWQKLANPGSESTSVQAAKEVFDMAKG